MVLRLDLTNIFMTILFSGDRNERGLIFIAWAENILIYGIIDILRIQRVSLPNRLCQPILGSSVGR